MRRPILLPSTSLLLLPTLLLAVVGCGPTVMLPGGQLSGEVKPVPASWTFTDEVETVQLETRPEAPYSVNVWAVAVGSDLYVTAGRGPETAWAGHIDQDPRVRLRVDDTIYELNAVLASDEQTRQAFLEAAQRKYDFEPTEEQRRVAILYRLEAR